MHQRTAVAITVLSTLAFFVPWGVVMYITGGSPAWWMLVAGMLMLINGMLSVYMAYHLYRTGAVPNSQTVNAISRALTLGALLFIFMPLYGPRVASLLR